MVKRGTVPYCQSTISEASSSTFTWNFVESRNIIYTLAMAHGRNQTPIPPSRNPAFNKSLVLHPGLAFWSTAYLTKVLPCFHRSIKETLFKPCMVLSLCILKKCPLKWKSPMNMRSWMAIQKSRPSPKALCSTRLQAECRRWPGHCRIVTLGS